MLRRILKLLIAAPLAALLLAPAGAAVAAPAPAAASGGLTMVATAYGPSARDNYPFGATDFFGRPLRPGDVAVDPRVIPLGSHLWISGYHDPALPAGGFAAVAVDTGGSISGRRLDIFIDGGPAAVSRFGIQPVTVRVVGG